MHGKRHRAHPEANFFKIRGKCFGKVFIPPANTTAGYNLVRHPSLRFFFLIKRDIIINRIIYKEQFSLFARYALAINHKLRRREYRIEPRLRSSLVLCSQVACSPDDAEDVRTSLATRCSGTIRYVTLLAQLVNAQHAHAPSAVNTAAIRPFRNARARSNVLIIFKAASAMYFRVGADAVPRAFIFTFVLSAGKTHLFFIDRDRASFFFWSVPADSQNLFQSAELTAVSFNFHCTHCTPLPPFFCCA